MERNEVAEVSNLNNGIVRMEENVKKIDILGNLPPEIAQKILMYSDPVNLINNVWNCCKVWRSIMNNACFWRMKCLTDGYSYVPSQNSENYQKIMQAFIPWEGIYKYNAALNYNLCNNIYTQINVENLVKSTEKLVVEEIYYFDDDLLAFRNSQKSRFITIIDVSLGVLKELLSLPRGLYVEVKRVGDFMIIVLNNWARGIPIDKRTFCSVWNIKCGTYVVENVKMRADPCAISYFKGFLIAYDDLLGFYVFDTDTKSIVFSYDSPQRYVSPYLHHHRNMVVHRCTGPEGHEDTIIAYNMENKTLRKIICCEGVECLLLSEGKYSILCCNNGHASIWNLETMKKLNSFQFNYNLFSSDKILINANAFICKKYNCYSECLELQIWSFISGTCINRIKLDSEPDNIMSNNRYIFIHEKEFTNVYCPRTGKVLLSIPRSQDSQCVKVSETKIIIGSPILYSNSMTDLTVLDYDNKIKI